MLRNRTNIPRGYQQLTVSTAAVALTIPTGANTVEIVVENASIRYRDDGTDPTASVGTLVYAGNSITVDNLARLSAMKFIRADSSDAVINANYYTT